ncbi:MAG: hypothetical protein K0M45_07110 [Candidatus Paracaedibacteraceae bacterium]|nr:hypothetical protein [Candidatus Paracaedibacteraceae bacterium]
MERSVGQISYDIDCLLERRELIGGGVIRAVAFFMALLTVAAVVMLFALVLP